MYCVFNHSDKITHFTKGQDGIENGNGVDLSIIAEGSHKAAISVLQPGDHVEVFEGEQSGAHGVLMEIDKDVVEISAIGVDIDGQKIVFPARSVRKRFKPGDHVKVSKDLREAAEVGSITNVIGKYELHDLVQPNMFHDSLKSLSSYGPSFVPDAQSPCSMTSDGGRRAPDHLL